MGKVSFTSNAVQAKGKLGKAAARGLTDATLDLLRRSAQDAPVDTGDLRGSGSATLNGRVTASNGGQSASGPPDVGQVSRLEGVVGFSTPYAVRQHEDMSARHPQGGKAKYLEDAYTQNRGRYQEHIEAAIREGMQ